MNKINITNTISVQKQANGVFRYISDLRLDKNWRKEINETKITDQYIQLNTIAEEDSYLSKKVPNHRATLQCTTYIPNKLIVYESLPENTFWIKNSRRVEKISTDLTEIIYTIEFDVAVVRYALGISLPLFLLKFYTRLTMNKYLKKLKQISEAGND